MRKKRFWLAKKWNCGPLVDVRINYKLAQRKFWGNTGWSCTISPRGPGPSAQKGRHERTGFQGSGTGKSTMGCGWNQFLTRENTQGSSQSYDLISVKTWVVRNELDPNESQLILRDALGGHPKGAIWQCSHCKCGVSVCVRMAGLWGAKEVDSRSGLPGAHFQPLLWIIRWWVKGGERVEQCQVHRA